MKKEEVEHLASLARIALTPEELDRLPEELSSIVSYVSVVSEIAAEDDGQTLTPRYNVFREDEVTVEPETHTADLLREMPETEGRYMKVRKILKTD